MSKEIKYDIVKFVDDEIELEVSVDTNNDTIWLTQEEISQLFGKARNTITEHINIIYKNNELDEEIDVKYLEPNVFKVFELLEDLEK